MKGDESRIKREGFPITREDANALLYFIDLYDSEHRAVEPELIVRLELLAGRYVLSEVIKSENKGDGDK